MAFFLTNSVQFDKNHPFFCPDCYAIFISGCVVWGFCVKKKPFFGVFLVKFKKTAKNVNLEVENRNFFVLPTVPVFERLRIISADFKVSPEGGSETLLNPF